MAILRHHVRVSREIPQGIRTE